MTSVCHALLALRCAVVKNETIFETIKIILLGQLREHERKELYDRC